MSEWSGRRTLVTGAGGFIGSHLVELLVSRGASVRAFVHYNARNDWGNLELVASEIRAEPFYATPAAAPGGVVIEVR